VLPTGLLAYGRPTFRSFPVDNSQWHKYEFRPDYSRAAAEGFNLTSLVATVTNLIFSDNILFSINQFLFRVHHLLIIKKLKSEYTLI
jgi:hypothetical protein